MTTVMELTCLSRGKGYYSPPCHVLRLGGFTLLVDCPLDLSSLSVFAPVPGGFGNGDRSAEGPVDATGLIRAEPWYKTVATLHLWDVSSIDVVLISSPMGMLGLPFLTRADGFSAKVYVTEAAAKLGLLAMNDLVLQHREFREFYSFDDSRFPRWMEWEELECLSPPLKETILGVEGIELGGWMPLYSAADAEDCVKKVQKLRYAEETCYNGTLMMKALSSGSEIGACNWTIEWIGRTVALVTGSIFSSGHALGFDCQALQSKDVLVYSESLSIDHVGSTEDDITHDSSPPRLDSLVDDASARSEEEERLNFICSCITRATEAGGSVLIPIGRLGIILQLLEQLSVCSEFTSSKVPMYIISPAAAETLAYTNVIPEWVCKQRQEKLFSGEPLFAHQELVKGGRLRAYPALYSPELLRNWQEPCIVFCPHWSLRLGPAVPLLRRWHSDPNSLLVTEEGVDAQIALAPFNIAEMKMKVLRYSFLSRIELKKITPLLEILQPKLAVLPEDLKEKVLFLNTSSTSISLAYYSLNETFRLPSSKDSSKIDISSDLVSQFQWKILKESNFSISRLKGNLVMRNGRPLILSRDELPPSDNNIPLMHFGTPDLPRLLARLTEMGIRGTIQGESECPRIVLIDYPEKAVIEVRKNSSCISAPSERLRCTIS
ncbi:hypothetical protein MLD38_008850 [Melastoma candidum]|uniref:Uncharacterized protein n=1 Tax=Melastoma candidum TaxID=119954 RepID=A0ACB9RVE1_9MYRT|nr:hypothetical protein MLD38_008850 [Melastoma candidum]